MNYLAHAFLSSGKPGLLVGNFIADHIRGNKLSDFPPEVVEGIHLHRRIDAFTDSHTEFRQAKRSFYNGFEKYSGVLVDIYFDFILAQNFAHYYPIDLKLFSQAVYNVYESHRAILPERSTRFLEYVLKNDIYSSYSTPEGIRVVLQHLSQRIRHGVQLDKSLNIFLANEETISRHFHNFFHAILEELKIDSYNPKIPLKI